MLTGVIFLQILVQYLQLLVCQTFSFFSVKVHSLFFVLVVTEALFVCSVSLTSCCVSVV